VFARAIADDAWPEHLAIISDFWSTVMLKTGRYRRNPFTAHQHIEGISPELFHHWLRLWRETGQELLTPTLRTRRTLRHPPSQAASRPACSTALEHCQRASECVRWVDQQTGRCFPSRMPLPKLPLNGAAEIRQGEGVADHR
jgi:truncated hemoglobin YjbI